jgi:hypothetical protein
MIDAVATAGRSPWSDTPRHAADVLHGDHGSPAIMGESGWMEIN